MFPNSYSVKHLGTASFEIPFKFGLSKVVKSLSVFLSGFINDLICVHDLFHRKMCQAQERTGKEGYLMR